MTTATKYSIQIEAALVNLAAIRDFIESAAVALGFEAEAASGMILAADEAASNTILHGYRNAPGEIDVEVNREEDTLIVTLRDTAPPFDPRKVKDPDMSLPPEDRMLGGMGIYMIRRAVDEVRYRELPEGNELTLVKRMG